MLTALCSVPVLTHNPQLTFGRVFFFSLWGCCAFRVVSALPHLLPALPCLLPALPSQMLVTNTGVTAHAGTQSPLGVQASRTREGGAQCAVFISCCGTPARWSWLCHCDRREPWNWSQASQGLRTNSRISCLCDPQAHTEPLRVSTYSRVQYQSILNIARKGLFS